MLRGLTASFILVSVCVLIHTVGLIFIADWLIRHPLKSERKFSVRRHAQLLTFVFALIILLHMLETLVWAAFYDMWGLFSDLETSWYFSLGSYSTIGYGDVVLPAKWRMLGGIEGITGVLLCGLSTAFLFVLVHQMFEKRLEYPPTPSRRAVI
jgi:hypothetical protein